MSKRLVSLITLAAMLLCLMVPAMASAAEPTIGTPTFSNITDTSVTVSFSYNANGGNMQAISLRYTPAGGTEVGVRLETADSGNLSSGTAVKTIDGLTPGTTYTFKSLYLANKDDAGTVVESAAATVTTLPQIATPTASVANGIVTFSVAVTEGNPATKSVVFNYTTDNGASTLATVYGAKNGNVWTGSMDVSRMAPGSYSFNAVATNTSNQFVTSASNTFVLTSENIIPTTPSLPSGGQLPSGGYYYNGYYYVPGYGYYIPGYGYMWSIPTTYYSYVMTNNPTNITSSGAVLNGFASNGITAAGFQVRRANGTWGEVLWGSDSSANYALKITGLKSGTAYYARAVGVAGNGYVYGDPVAFVTTGYPTQTVPVVPSVPTVPSYPSYTVPGGSLPGSNGTSSIPKTGVDSYYGIAAVMMLAGVALIATAKRREA